ncbi:globin domain-containing protein [Micromonospora sp. WMMC273]|uniref:globin domain-containing protein n=1 Tax=Micromonospora sp. WMMC273 TaxID=3015157 RepID=UPI0022B6341F|nr:globin domain-containing protein [Micromonospora sp. WMMC273]MCZ7478905.1 globin domain-containing protein [Micromonospora sp. WMMC273]
MSTFITGPPINAASLRASWTEVEKLGDEAARIFYSLLFAAEPATRSMFPAGMTEQRDKLLSALGHIISNVDDTNLLADFAAQLGRDHRRFGVVAHHYKAVGNALMETLRRALGRHWTPELETEWQRAYDLIAAMMVDGARADEQVNPPAWRGTIEHIDRRSPDLAALTVAVDLPYHFMPGQSCAVEHPSRPGVWRYLTPINPPRDDNRLGFLVRAVPGGLLSPALVYQAKPGDLLRIGAPVGTALTGWHRDPGPVLFIAGGTGLAPFAAVIQHLATDPTWRWPVTLIYGVDQPHELREVNALRELERHLPWLTIVPVVSRDPDWTGYRGTAVEVAVRGGEFHDRYVYLCGSEAMIGGSIAMLLANGYSRRQIRVETFTSTSYPPLAPLALPSGVTS